MKKLESEYTLDKLPELGFTSVDLEQAEEFTDENALTEEQILALFKFMKAQGCGEIFTQVDSGSDYPDRLYSRGVRFVNRTGVYAFVFGEFEPETKCGECDQPISVCTAGECIPKEVEK